MNLTRGARRTSVHRQNAFRSTTSHKPTPTKKREPRRVFLRILVYRALSLRSRMERGKCYLSHFLTASILLRLAISR